MLNPLRREHVQAAPFFSFSRVEWVPCAIRWVEKVGLFERVENIEGSPDYATALEVSRFLVRSLLASTRSRR
jgi:hypothetical protein